MTMSEIRLFTYTGKTVNLADFQPEDVDIVDIAHALSNLCRYNGHSNRFYSVAEHCARLSRYCHNQNVESPYHRSLARAALLHDAAEAYIGDIVYHFKPMLPQFVELEKKIEAVIFTKLGLNEDFVVAKKELHELDRAISYDEMYQLYGRVDPWFIENKVGPLGAGIMVGPNDRMGWTPEQAKDQFLICCEFFGLYQRPPSTESKTNEDSSPKRPRRKR